MAKLFLVLMCLAAGCLTLTAANPFFFFNLQPAPTITVSQPTVARTADVGIGNLFSKWFTITKSFGPTQRPRPIQRPVIQIDPIYVPVDLEEEEGPKSTTEVPAELIESSTEKKTTTTERITTTTTRKLTSIDTTEQTSTSTSTSTSESTASEEEYIKPTTYRPSTTSRKTTTTTESETEIENENEIDSGSEDSSNEIIKPETTTTTSTSTSTTTEAPEEVAEVTEEEIPISLTYLPPLSGRTAAGSIKTSFANTKSSDRTPFDIISVRAGDSDNVSETAREDVNEEEPEIDPRVFYY